MTLEDPGPAWLFCPADRPDRFAKAASVADVVILDLEDGVATADKVAARLAVSRCELDPTRTVVRINAPGTREQESDLEVLSETPFRTVMLPKCESAGHVTAVAPYEVLIIVETPLGALNVSDAACAENAIGVMWGAEDLFAALGGTANRFADGRYRDVARYVRSVSLLAAKAYGKLALDAVFIDFADLGGLAAEVDDASAVGFDVKVAIHPTQLPVIRGGFTPGESEVGWAKTVLAAAAGQPGAFAHDGMMIDAPVLLRAERILRLAQVAGES
jgi:citrate lyase subunit beta / citryl-CoA lyase